MNTELMGSLIAVINISDQIIKISDTGLGIPEESIQKIFEPLVFGVSVAFGVDLLDNHAMLHAES